MRGVQQILHQCFTRITFGENRLYVFGGEDSEPSTYFQNMRISNLAKGCVDGFTPMPIETMIGIAVHGFQCLIDECLGLGRNDHYCTDPCECRLRVFRNNSAWYLPELWLSPQ